MLISRKLRWLNAGLLVSILSACAVTPPVAELAQEELKDRLQRSVVSISPVKVPARLVERTKGQAVGNFLMASIVSSAAGSGTGARNASEMQANMQITQEFGTALNKALPTGAETDGGWGADVLLAKRLAERFPESTAPTDTDIVELAVSSPRWELDYESFLASSDYALKYELEIRALAPAPDGPQLLKRIRCQGSAPTKRTLEKWQADGYEAVGREAKGIADDCFQLTMKTFGLE